MIYMNKGEFGILLQWGHNFFVMEIWWGFIVNPPVGVLQWGHNFFVMEIELNQDITNHAFLASMGP